MKVPTNYIISHHIFLYLLFHITITQYIIELSFLRDMTCHSLTLQTQTFYNAGIMVTDRGENLSSCLPVCHTRRNRLLRLACIGLLANGLAAQRNSLTDNISEIGTAYIHRGKLKLVLFSYKITQIFVTWRLILVFQYEIRLCYISALIDWCKVK